MVSPPFWGRSCSFVLPGIDSDCRCMPCHAMPCTACIHHLGISSTGVGVGVGVSMGVPMASRPLQLSDYSSSLGRVGRRRRRRRKRGKEQGNNYSVMLTQSDARRGVCTPACHEVESDVWIRHEGAIAGRSGCFVSIFYSVGLGGMPMLLPGCCPCRNP